jgi:hypothetical protein
MKYGVDKFGNDAFVPSNKVFEVDDFGNYVFLFPSSSAITASIAEVQTLQTEAIVAAEKYSAIIAESQTAQTEAIIAAERYSATIAETQAAQTEAIVAAKTYTAALSEAQASQAEAIDATVGDLITAAIVEGQAQQTDTIVCYLPVAPPGVATTGGSALTGGTVYFTIPSPRKRKRTRKPVPVAVEAIPIPRPRPVRRAKELERFTLIKPLPVFAQTIPDIPAAMDEVKKSIRMRARQNREAEELLLVD